MYLFPFRTSIVQVPETKARSPKRNGKHKRLVDKTLDNPVNDRMIRVQLVVRVYINGAYATITFKVIQVVKTNMNQIISLQHAGGLKGKGF